MPIKNVLNDMYARDISRKTKAAFRAKARNGEYICSKSPFGYVKSPENKHKLIADDRAAETVKYIFMLASNGMGYNQMAKKLRKEKILNPIAYLMRIILTISKVIIGENLLTGMLRFHLKV